MKKKIVLFGKEMTGKTTLQKRLGELGYPPIIQITNRPKRNHEINGIDYYFVESDFFEYTKIIRGAFFSEIRHYPKHDYWYGTPYFSLETGSVLVTNPVAFNSMPEIVKSEFFRVYLENPNETEDFLGSENAKRTGTTEIDEMRRKQDFEDFHNFTDYDLKMSTNDLEEKVKTILKYVQ